MIRVSGATVRRRLSRDRLRMYLRVEDEPDPQEVSILDDRIRAEAIDDAAVGTEVEFAIFVREGREVRAGIYGWTWGGTCELQTG